MRGVCMLSLCVCVSGCSAKAPCLAANSKHRSPSPVHAQEVLHAAQAEAAKQLADAQSAAVEAEAELADVREALAVRDAALGEAEGALAKLQRQVGALLP